MKDSDPLTQAMASDSLKYHLHDLIAYRHYTHVELDDLEDTMAHKICDGHSVFLEVI